MNKLVLIAAIVVVLIIIGVGLWYYMSSTDAAVTVPTKIADLPVTTATYGPWVSGARYQDGGGTIWTASVNAGIVTINANRSSENVGNVNMTASTISFPGGGSYSYIFDSSGGFSISNAGGKDYFKKL